MPGALTAICVAALTLGALAAPARAQKLDSLQKAWLLPYPHAAEEAPISDIVTEAARRAPGSSLNTPVAFGAGWGTVYAGAGLQGRVRYLGYRPNADGAGGQDGSVVAGLGLGNPQKWVGVDLSVVSLGTARSFGRFAFGAKVHRRLPRRAAVAVGVEHAAVIGPTDAKQSLFGVATKQFALRESPSYLFSSLTASLGIGNSRFIPEDDYLAGKEGVNIFGSLGLRIAEPVGVIADWTGQDLILAASLTPFRRIPLVISTGFADVLGTAGDGARFVAGAGVGLHIPSYFSRR